MLNATLQIYLLMIFKLTHIYLLNLEIEIPNKTIFSFKKNNHNLAFPVQLLRVGRPYFPKIFSIRSKETTNKCQDMKGLYLW